MSSRDVTAGDYLQGFLRGTRTALYESGRESITVCLPYVTPFTVGALIALYERAVGFYGSLVNVNAYHQPGVEAGKKAATAVLDLQKRVAEAVAASTGQSRTAEEIAASLGTGDVETVYHVLQHLAENRTGWRRKEGAKAGADAFLKHDAVS